MMGQEHTPLRSMAAYVNCVSELSGWSYTGNLKVADHAVLLARCQSVNLHILKAVVGEIRVIGERLVIGRDNGVRLE